MSESAADLIDQVLSITPGSRLDGLRRHREVARDNIQKAYLALFEPSDASEVSRLERFAIASFVAGLHSQLVLGAHYAHQLTVTEGGTALAATINREIDRGTTEGPYGDYPPGPLAGENKSGLHYAVASDSRQTLGDKLSAALDHAHLLVFRPRDASQAAVESLRSAGWSTAGVVTISQLVAYLSFQLRIVQGLSVLAATAEQPEAANTDTLSNPQPASATA